MKYFSILTLALTMALILSACGAKVTPTPAISAVDMLNTSAAVAFTMVAQTQAAIPTATPLPPPTAAIANTLAPITAFVPSPGPELTSTPDPNDNAGGGTCREDTVMPDVLQGTKIKMRINNSTKVALHVSVYLNQTTHGQCGYRAYNVEAGQPIVITDLVEGCYTIFAWNPDQDHYFIVTNGTDCIMDSSYPAVFDISTSSIKLR
jgi:hypothetical protein